MTSSQGEGAGIRFQKFWEEDKELRTSSQGEDKGSVTNSQAEEGVGIQFQCLPGADMVSTMSLEEDTESSLNSGAGMVSSLNLAEDMVSRSRSEEGTASPLMLTVWMKKRQLG